MFPAESAAIPSGVLNSAAEPVPSKNPFTSPPAMMTADPFSPIAFGGNICAIPGALGYVEKLPAA